MRRAMFYIDRALDLFLLNTSKENTATCLKAGDYEVLTCLLAIARFFFSYVRFPFYRSYPSDVKLNTPHSNVPLFIFLSHLILMLFL